MFYLWTKLNITACGITLDGTVVIIPHAQTLQNQSLTQ